MADRRTFEDWIGVVAGLSRAITPPFLQPYVEPFIRPFSARPPGAQLDPESIDTALIVADANGTIVAANRHASELFRCDSGDLTGAAVAELFRDGSSTNGDAPGDRIALRKDGSSFVARVCAGAADAQGCVATLISDVTAERTEELRYGDDARRVRLALEAGQLGTWTLDIGAGRMSCGERLQGLLGMEPGTFDGKVATFLSRVHPQDASRVADVLLRSPLKASAHQLQFRVVLPRGEVRHFKAHACVVCDSDGRPTRMIGVCRDITEHTDVDSLIAARTHQLLGKIEDLSDYVRIVAHDLKEPLRGITSFANFIGEDAGASLPEEARKGLDRIITLTTRMNDVINAMLTAARIDWQAPSLKESDLDEMLREVLESLESFLRQQRVEVRVPRPLPTVMCDGSRIAEVFRNLVVNAAKYNDKESKWVEVGWLDDEAGAPSGGPTFYVRDNGIGIPDEARETVFGMFKRLHPRDAFGGGTGAGLAIVKKIIEGHGGRIWVASSPDEGSTFYFTIGIPETTAVGPATNGAAPGARPA